MSVTELETRIVKMQEWEQLAQDAAAEAEAIRDTIKAEMLARDTEGPCEICPSCSAHTRTDRHSRAKWWNSRRREAHRWARLF